MLVDIEPCPELEQAVQRAMVCAPVGCKREAHCLKMALALRDVLRQCHAQGWDGLSVPQSTAPPSWETAR